jgi:hypothetical protein
MGASVKCAVCGKRIEPNESRFVDVAGGIKIHVHVACKDNNVGVPAKDRSLS